MDEATRQARLREIDDELSSLRTELEQLQQESAQPGDPADAGANLAAREQLTTRVEDLEAERSELTDEPPPDQS